MQINRTNEELRELQDAFLVLDAAHFVRRPVAAFFRGAMGLTDENDGMAHARTLRARVLPRRFASIAGL